MCCGNSILQKGLPFFYLHKIFYTLKSLEYEYLCKDLKAYIINTENITSISRVNEIVTFANGEQLEMGKRSIDKLKNFMQEKIENESF